MLAYVLLLQLSSTSVAAEPARSGAEGWLHQGVQGLRLAVEAVGAGVIALGVGMAAFYFVRALLQRQAADFNQIRLILSRYLALALEFQLGSDILSTAVAPSWDQIGKLAAIAVIRTVLNYFLTREMEEENGRRQQQEQQLVSDVNTPGKGTAAEPTAPPAVANTPPG